MSGHSSNPNVAHHFESMEQQFESGKFGMWLFLATEVLLFGGLFAAYAVYRALHPEVFLYSSQYLDRVMGGINTIVLIFSSFTMAWAVRAAQLNQRNLCAGLLAITFVCGCGFMGIKYFEYKHKFEAGYLWAGNPREGHEPIGSVFSPKELAEHQLALASEQAAQGADPAAEAAHAGPTAASWEQIPAEERSLVSPAALGPAGVRSNLAELEHEESMFKFPWMKPVSEDHADDHADEGHHGMDWAAGSNAPRGTHWFFGIYFVMTGLHGLHVLMGMGIIGWLIWRTLKGHFSEDNYAAVDIGGLYWHLVDLIWIFLFPLLYLI